MDATSLLVIGAGPYGVAIAAHARRVGIGTTIVGRSMAFWRDRMPAGMFLRSGPDWHLDASGVHTFEAYIAEAGIDPADIDPVPISVFLGYAAWFQQRTGVEPADRRVATVGRSGNGFEVEFADGGRLFAERVVAATGIDLFRRLPAWSETVPPGVGRHTCDVVTFDDLDGARVLIVGGRQSAYEWAALAADHGAARIDVVHRHPTPSFERISWKFVDPWIEQTLAVPGWWKTLDDEEQAAVSRTFWEVGRLTLEWWLTPRLPSDRVRSWAETSVAEVAAGADAAVSVRLSNGERLDVDHVIYATGYEVDIAKVPYLAPLLSDIETVDGFPVLDTGFQSSVPGLYFTGFTTTKEFGPFFGFTKGCPAAADILVGAVAERVS